MSSKGVAMARRSIIFLIVLFVFLPIFAHCLPAKNVSPSSHRFRLHPWWNLTSAQIKQYFAEGRANRGKAPVIPTNPPALGYITPEMWIIDATLYSPPFALRYNGAYLKAVKVGNKWHTDDKTVRQDVYMRYSLNAIFDVTLKTTGLQSDLKKVKFLVENNLGDKNSCRDLQTPSFYFPDEHHIVKGAYYTVGTPLNTLNAKKLVSADAKWLRLWIIAKDQRLPVTFWLDNSEKVQFGKSIKSK
jgi:hypothetical protein